MASPKKNSGRPPPRISKSGRDLPLAGNMQADSSQVITRDTQSAHTAQVCTQPMVPGGVQINRER